MAEPRVGKKRLFDAAFKLTVFEHASQSSNRAAAAKFFIDEKSVREWRKKKELLTLPDRKKRIVGGGQKAKVPEIWISDMRSNNQRITWTQIQRKALELTQGIYNFIVIKISALFYTLIGVTSLPVEVGWSSSLKDFPFHFVEGQPSASNSLATWYPRSLHSS